MNGVPHMVFVGVHNDEDICYNKGGSPVMNELERYDHMKSIKWCDKLIPAAPYVTDPQLMDEYSCQFVLHGDDITTDHDGNDCYQIVKDLGRFVVVKRTQGVSTTDIIHRILTDTYSYKTKDIENNANNPKLWDLQLLTRFCKDKDAISVWDYVFYKNFNNVIVKGGYELVKNDEKGKITAVSCYYIEDYFDLFNVGDIEIFQTIKSKYAAVYGSNTKLIVGVLSSSNVGCINTLLERCLSLLSCKYIDGIVIDPDSDIFSSMTNNVQISKLDKQTIVVNHKQDLKFQYLTRDLIMQRIKDNSQHYIKRNIKKGMSYE
ncbi:ethanolamine-phosphate cytidylyltransferase SCDLUD_001459 [Saccharomycodes ludwigii]|uniref:ethanolamine-phosphate cytidylyltransferase n=1 Tax=Saccharomycodes ludwigii TaxID=36035 RepID=UPI001E8845A6|nr:hypothetical protein SCDLUD_001459 [Saccharomycodes ludwigii]KAH3901688.1 hypothetical protein SCDLUD_001459 [Saccharomycodes ludwigii]